MDDIWELECEDLTSLGGPMGSEDTHTLWTKLFTTYEAAKKYAEEHHWSKYAKWKKYDGYFYADAASVGYRISLKEIND